MHETTTVGIILTAGKATRFKVSDRNKTASLLRGKPLVQYGDHLMHYTPDLMQKIIAKHQAMQATVTLVAARFDQPDALAWGRIITNEEGAVQAIIEQKDASPEERQVTLLNAGFYCSEYEFLTQAIHQLEPSVTTGEYYVTDIIGMAVATQKTVACYEVPLAAVDSGVNTTEQLAAIENISID